MIVSSVVDNNGGADDDEDDVNEATRSSEDVIHNDNYDEFYKRNKTCSAFSGSRRYFSMYLCVCTGASAYVNACA